MEGLLKKQTKDSITHKKNIRYYCYTPSNTNYSNENNIKQFSFTPPSNIPESELVEVHVEPKNHLTTKKFSPLDSLNNKWFINWSHEHIPDNIQQLLQLGHNFSLPSVNSNNNITQTIKNIENNIMKLHTDDQNTIRNYAIPLLHNLNNPAHYCEHTDLKIINLIKCTNKFIKNKPNVIFTRADKGNITVALNRSDYINKMEDILKDKETYELIRNDPLRKLTNDIRSLLSRWKTKGYISKATYNSIYCSDGNIPRAYGLPKVHKPGFNYRIIISSVDSPTYQLAHFLHKIISKNINKPFSHIDNSFQLIKKLKGTFLDTGYDLISLDVVSLFTNIPIDLAMDSLTTRWEKIKEGTSIPRGEFLTAVRMVLNSTFFSFNRKIYKQKFGTPMGSPMSPIIADLVMDDLETKALKIFSFQVPFYFRYVDDIMLAVPFNKSNEVLDAFSSFHPRLKFTIEIGGKNLNFLDVTIINNNNFLEFDVYKKPTFSGRVLNFLSNHPLSQKRGVIMSMVDRTFLLSHPKYHQKNLNFIIETFMGNGYPLDFIIDTISIRLKKLLNEKTRKQNETLNEDGYKGWFLIPFIPKLNGKFKNIANTLKSKLAFFSLHKLGRIIRAQKDTLPLGFNKNVVYKLNCKDCDASYIGQTKRRLNTRVMEHKKDISKKTVKHSVITEHRLQFNHDFDWDNPTILDKEKRYYRRLISEMINIKTHSNTINLQSDTELLQHAYCEIFNRLKK